MTQGLGPKPRERNWKPHPRAIPDIPGEKETSNQAIGQDHCYHKPQIQLENLVWLFLGVRVGENTILSLTAKARVSTILEENLLF